MKTILCVEDETAQLEILSYILKSHGYNVLAASSAEDGLQLLETNSPDLIISDIKLPNMDGYTFLETVRANAKFKTTLFFIVSAFGDAKAVERARSLGANDYITKPYDIDEVSQLVDKLLK